MSLTSGARLKTTASSLEVIVVTPPATDDALLAAGAEMSTDAQPGPAGGDTILPIGKRFVDPASGIEVLVVKPGPGPLTIGGVELTLKQAKPLPASD